MSKGTTRTWPLAMSYSVRTLSWTGMNAQDSSVSSIADSARFETSAASSVPKILLAMAPYADISMRVSLSCRSAS